ncbi:MAG: hypothetical protein HUK13_04005 [Muribaculaceae bacterium]|nr:hypothetical protein [Muribaculaceae bacterium]
MKANKRTYRKYVTRVCGDLAGECMFAGMFDSMANQEELSKIIVEIARLQSKTFDRLNISFDKAPREFANKAEYNKAHCAYFKKAYKALSEDFAKEVQKVVDQMNKAVPRKK